MEFSADDAVRVTVGQEPAIGKPAVRESFLRRLAQPSKEIRAKGAGDSLAQVQGADIAENSFSTFPGDTLNRFRQSILSGPPLLNGGIPQAEPAFMSN